LTDTVYEENNFEDLSEVGTPGFLPTISMTELYNSVYRDKPAVIEGLLYPGTYLFVGAPKQGKSFLMLQMAYHISTGNPLWNYPVRQGTVLYLALEDDHSRLQSRLYRMFGAEATESLFLSVWSKQVGNGLSEQIEQFVRKHPDTVLVIIDTLQKVRTTSDRYSYASDYENISTLKELATKLSICLLIVHHTRKQSSDDKFEMISGTNGLLGAADGAFILEKERRTAKTATLEISGRDQQEQRLHLQQDLATLQWLLERAETELWQEPPEPLLQMVSQLLTKENPLWEGTPTDLAQALGLDMKPNQLSTKLNVNVRRLAREHNIRYRNSRTHAGRKITLELIDSEA
jgi:RecA-family ATPase